MQASGNGARLSGTRTIDLPRVCGVGIDLLRSPIRAILFQNINGKRESPRVNPPSQKMKKPPVERRLFRIAARNKNTHEEDNDAAYLRQVSPVFLHPIDGSFSQKDLRCCRPERLSRVDAVKSLRVC
jgi:hypothetical protein